jgi:hypothetical protein
MASEETQNQSDGSCITCHLLRDIPAEQRHLFIQCEKHSVRPADPGLFRSYRCSLCRHRIEEIRPGVWRHLPTKHSQWGPVCVTNPHPLEWPPPITAAVGPV